MSLSLDFIEKRFGGSAKVGDIKKYGLIRASAGIDEVDES